VGGTGPVCGTDAWEEVGAPEIGGGRGGLPPTSRAARGRSGGSGRREASGRLGLQREGDGSASVCGESPGRALASSPLHTLANGAR
jgi:hypothetical protein